MQLPITWRAIHTDTVVNEDAGKYTDIDRATLIQVDIIRRADNATMLSIHFRDDMRPIMRHRWELMDTGPTGRYVFLCGWQTTRQGVNFQTVFAIRPDGAIHALDRFQQDHPWLYAPGKPVAGVED